METEEITRDVLAPGYAVRHPQLADAAGVHALLVASDISEFGEAEGYSLDELEAEWREIDLGQNVWIVVAPDGPVAGYLYLQERLHVRIDVEIYIHPEHFGRGIGSSLVWIAETRAEELAALAALAPPNERVVLNNWINALNADACALLEREGYRPVRYFLRMVIDLGAEPEGVDLPAGFAVRAGVPGEDLRPFFETTQEAMADHWGHLPSTFEEWRERSTGSGFDPTLWFLVTEGDEPVGAALCRIADEIGWIGTLGVRGPWRQRGLGLALVRHAIREFYGRGMRRVGLTVDTESPTGATRLYERAGMRMDQQYATYQKVLRGDG